MIYRAIGLMSGSSLDGLDVAFVEFTEQGGKWQFEVKATACIPYNDEWTTLLGNATTLSAYEYQLLHTRFGHYLGEKVNEFIATFQLDYQVQLIASHGHTVFHDPAKKMTAQLGDGAAIAATTGINVVSDLRALDIALGGQGAPIVPIGEQFLFSEYPYLLNIGGIANISMAKEGQYIAFDVAPANRVLNLLAGKVQRAYDENGTLAAAGTVDHAVLEQLNALEYYHRSYPKSLANEFGIQHVFPLLDQLQVNDALATYTAHIAVQVENALHLNEDIPAGQLLVTGGGAHNTFLIGQIRDRLAAHEIEVVIPEPAIIDFKEAIIMAFIGVLRWRENNNALSSVTGALRDSIGGALWIGQEY